MNLPWRRKKRDESSDDDESFWNGGFYMFDPLAMKKKQLSSVQGSYVKKMFSILIKAEAMDESFGALSIKKSSDQCLQVKELDPDLLGVISESQKCSLRIVTK